ncbi:MAG: endolytic transglycosylase MltG [Bacilli bacterium]|nr:endolytic transglycosylase MltG [Bacilli bacterium]
MKKIIKIVIILVVMVLLILAAGLICFNMNIKPVQTTSEEVELEIKENMTYSTLGSVLKENGLIRSELWYKVYIKVYKPNNLQKGFYKLDKNMSLKEIIDNLEEGSTFDPNIINITFKEGLNVRKVAKVIDEKTDNTYDDVLNLMKDKDYIKSLISNYWFLTDEILDSKIYYPLEGYLFPETYSISSKASVKEIFKVLLDQTDKVLTKYKDKINSSKYSVHKLVTLASIVELEAGKADDRASVAGVFYNRLNSKWSLGSDVTTYYAIKQDDFSHSLTKSEIATCNNGYNTRCSSLVGLPVGPISNPGEESINAVMNPASHSYYYFVADKNGKTYLSKTYNEHNSTIAKLKKQGLWQA